MTPSHIPGGVSLVPPTWEMVLTSLSNVNLGQISDAHDREFNFKLNQPGTISFKSNLLAPMATTIIAQKEGYIKLYRDRVLQMTAEISGVQVVGMDGEHSVAVTATESMWPILQKRLLGQSTAGLLGPTTPTDQGTWLAARLDDLNTINATGIANLGGVAASGNISGGVWRYKPFMELMQELANSTSGFDFWQVPKDPAGAVTGRTGELRIAPLKGTSRPNVVFEFGTGRANAASYEYLIDSTLETNAGFIVPPDFPDSPGLQVASATDAASITARRRREVLIPSDIVDYTLRSNLAAQHVAIRKVPREQFKIQPAPADGTGRVPEFRKDYTIGDVTRGRVKDQGVLMLDAMVRIYGVKVSPNDEGQEVVELTVINDGTT